MEKPIFNVTSYFHKNGMGSDVEAVSYLLGDSYIALYGGIFGIYNERQLIEKNIWEFENPIQINGCVFTRMFWNELLQTHKSEIWGWHKFPYGPVILNEGGGTISVDFVINNGLVDCRGMILQKREFE